MARKLLGWKVLDRGLGVAHADEMTMVKALPTGDAFGFL